MAGVEETKNTARIQRKRNELVVIVGHVTMLPEHLTQNVNRVVTHLTPHAERKSEHCPPLAQHQEQIGTTTEALLNWHAPASEPTLKATVKSPVDAVRSALFIAGRSSGFGARRL